MNICFLGTGSAFCLENYQTNTIIEKNGKRLLIDAGGDIRFSLKDFGLSYKDIDSVYITHLHGDHCGGLEYLAFSRMFDPSTGLLPLIGNVDLLEELWLSTLKGGLKCIQGKQTDISDFFKIQPLPYNGSFEWEGVKFETVQTVHVMDGYAIVPSYGLIFTDPDSGKRIYYTSDTQFNPRQIMDFYKESDLIIQDCETTPYQSGVHAHISELETLPEDIKEKMVLFHYQDNVVTNSSEWLERAETSGFGSNWDALGFIPKGYLLRLE